MMDRSKSTSNLNQNANQNSMPAFNGQNINKYSTQQSNLFFNKTKIHFFALKTIKIYCLIIDSYLNRQDASTPKLNLLTIKREETFKKSLPQIKTERDNRADTWRQKRNRNKSDMYSEFN